MGTPEITIQQIQKRCAEIVAEPNITNVGELAVMIGRLAEGVAYLNDELSRHRMYGGHDGEGLP